jgi:hypothetical protein
MKTEQSVPERQHIKYRRRRITQKKTYNIQNMAKVSNQESNIILPNIRNYLPNDKASKPRILESTATFL